MPELLSVDLGDWVARRAATHPDVVAVECSGEALTYAALEARVASTAGRLAALGIRPGEPVGLLHANSNGFAVFAHGITRAGGMLAPWCESETAEPLIGDLGREALAFWQEHFSGTVTKGTLVFAPKRDLPDLQRFSRRTSEYRWVDAKEIAEIEPQLAGVHSQALFFPKEGHLDPRKALAGLVALCALGPGERGAFTALVAVA